MSVRQVTSGLAQTPRSWFSSMYRYRYAMVRFLSQFKKARDYSVRIENIQWSEEFNRAVDSGFVKLLDKPQGCDYNLTVRCTLKGRLYYRRHRKPDRV
jgi:hypothetical protein